MISLERREGRPLRIGHRGAAALAPENTLRSFRAAVEAGVDLIEFDVLELEHGELVLAHSDDLHEVSHGAARGTMRGQTLAALRETAPELPTLDDALDFFVDEAPDVGVHVDLKSPRAVEGTLDALRRRGLTRADVRQLVPRGGATSPCARSSRVSEPGLPFPEIESESPVAAGRSR